ncbi:hypothetical protein [Thalassotalea sp. Y01]|uniref:hypothetical protein n=1 Tax=Thalassotalea sp. Y01 TaxID=2729613 RepID=UPI00145F6C07|nr:hypothetical protein [Thalassotalea sp. Y01]NMP15660.1 hypothetical protein [Thalassotalea sp. Y01]
MADDSSDKESDNNSHKIELDVGRDHLYFPYGDVPCPTASTPSDRWWFHNRRRHKHVQIKRSIQRRRR